MANGLPRVNARQGFDVETRLRLLENDADQIIHDLSQEIARAQRDLKDEIDGLRKDYIDFRNETQQAFRRMTGFGLTIIGGVLTGLILLVVTLAQGS